MTIREAVVEKLRHLFVINQDELEMLEDAKLALADGILQEIESFQSSIDNIFVDDGFQFIKKVDDALHELRNVGIDLDRVMPGSKNLLIALQFANMITIDELDSDLPQDAAQFHIHEVSNFPGLHHVSGEPVKAFAYVNADILEQSICFFDLTSDSVEISSAEANGISILSSIAAIKICEANYPLAGRMWIMTCAPDVEMHMALLKYHALLQGNLLTQPVLSPVYKGTEGIAETIRYSIPYSQFLEPFDMLNEINARKTIIDSFLSAYHTLENYMIRSRIAEVERAHDGSTFFSIRQFRRIHSAIDKGEAEQLRILFKACWDLEVGGKTISAYVLDRIAALQGLLTNSGGLQDPDLKTFLSKIGVSGDIVPNNADFRLISSIIYQIRCSIVHNKETEYHISNKELSNLARQGALTELCIPVMLRIAFGLPSLVHPSPISYSRKEIVLY